jgi:hypothetical protein
VGVGAAGVVSGERVRRRGAGALVQVPAVTPALAHGLSFPATRRRRVLLGDESEKSFQRRVVQLAELYGWVAWHQLDSTGTRAGLPDLILLRPPRVVFAELKSQHGRVRLEQAQTIALLEHCPGVQVFCWRPSDWQQIVEVLR